MSDVIIKWNNSGFCAFTKHDYFLQQCSPRYIYKKCLVNWCKKNGYNIVKAFDENYKISKFIGELKQTHTDNDLLELAYKYHFKWFKDSTVSKIDGVPTNGLYITNDKFILYKFRRTDDYKFDVTFVNVFNYKAELNNDF